MKIGFKSQNTNNMSQVIKEEKYKTKKEVLEKVYNDKYERAKKMYKIDNGLLAFLTIGSGLCATFGQKTNKKEALFFTGLGLLGFAIKPFFKPKKEKYDAMMQKELNEVG